jgi:hypothetical protein
MHKNVYSRPAGKPATCPVTKRRQNAEPLPVVALPEPLFVDKSTECHVTPPDVAARMVDYLDAPECCTVLEPSAGTGALVNALTDSGHKALNIFRVERNQALWQVLQMGEQSPGCCRCFLEWSQRAAQYPRIVMNPPFRQIKAHMSAALALLGKERHDDARLVALVPVTFEHPEAVELERLPADTFPTAKVNTKIIEVYRP